MSRRSCSAAADPFPEPQWDKTSLAALTAEYEEEFAKFDLYPDGWMGKRGEADEQTRHIAAAGAWGLFPNKDAAYINYNGHLPAEVCHTATYQVPENDAFWSVTLYGADGYMKSVNNILNASNTKMNADGTFTVHFGSKEACGDVELTRCFRRRTRSCLGGRAQPASGTARSNRARSSCVMPRAMVDR